MTDVVPSIHLAASGSGAGNRKLALAREVARACEEIGFFKIRGHGVPQALVDRAFATASAFFCNPQHLHPQKARLLLMLAPAQTGDIGEIRRMFAVY